jgi:hypothetical protein
MKQKHYECIVAWAEGKTIQFESVHGNWKDVPHPIWDRCVNYRVKPEPTPDFTTYLTVAHNRTGNQTSCRFATDTVKFTYDGETGELKSAEVLK